MAVTLEADAEVAENTAGNGEGHVASSTVQYEFSSLGTDLAASLRLIGERVRSLTRGSSAAIALMHKGVVMCRASVGESAPALGTRLDVNSGLSGECFREGRTLRCDDTENDPRVDLESCRKLGVRSMLAAPVRYERDTLGLLMVFATEPFNFDEGDVAVVESLAHTVVRSMRQAEGVG
jgi:GAF domain-containing protein